MIEKVQWRAAILRRKAFGCYPGATWGDLLWHILPVSLRKAGPSEDLTELCSETNGIETFSTRWGQFLLPQPGKEVLESLLREIFVDQEYENEFVRVDPGDVVIDCGAHVGVFTRFALQRGASHVISVEMDDVNFQCLQANLQQEREKVQMHRAALWHQKAVLPFFPGAYSDCHRVGSRGDAAGKKEAVPLDALIEKMGLSRVDFLKVDVEGSEPEVLMGASRTIQRYKPKLALALYHDPLEEKRVRRLFQNFSIRYQFSYRHFAARLTPYILFGRAVN